MYLAVEAKHDKFGVGRFIIFIIFAIKQTATIQRL
jgi:hypothetical protein